MVDMFKLNIPNVLTEGWNNCGVYPTTTCDRCGDPGNQLVFPVLIFKIGSTSPSGRLSLLYLPHSLFCTILSPSQYSMYIQNVPGH